MNQINKNSVLIVDDQETSITALANILSRDYKIYSADNGQQALELAEELSPDIILLDILMPDMSGFDVIEKLKASALTKNIPVIFITGLTSDDDEETGLRLGAVDYITKPFKEAIVKARVNTHLKIAEQMRTIERIGLTDPLTQISNRRGFNELFDTEWRKAIKKRYEISFLMIDADNFKDYNDIYGHQQGDVLLKAIADVFKESAENPDCAARWGGEEFVMLLPGTGSEEAAEIAENIRKKVEALVIPAENGRPTKITISIGVNTIIPDDETQIADFVNKADQALYKAKETGRNKVVTSRS
ncbi:MAG: diguanylate cyclase [Oscillospiraceae bacterium]|nr:diguanylate cyclase [Oscillospiraceae bacterium]